MHGYVWIMLLIQCLHIRRLFDIISHSFLFFHENLSLGIDFHLLSMSQRIMGVSNAIPRLARSRGCAAVCLESLLPAPCRQRPSATPQSS